jgi:hypothetical protein
VSAPYANMHHPSLQNRYVHNTAYGTLTGDQLKQCVLSTGSGRHITTALPASPTTTMLPCTLALLFCTLPSIPSVLWIYCSSHTFESLAGQHIVSMQR